MVTRTSVGVVVATGIATRRAGERTLPAAVGAATTGMAATGMRVAAVTAIAATAAITAAAIAAAAVAATSAIGVAIIGHIVANIGYAQIAHGAGQGAVGLDAAGIERVSGVDGDRVRLAGGVGLGAEIASGIGVVTCECGESQAQSQHYRGCY